MPGPGTASNAQTSISVVAQSSTEYALNFNHLIGRCCTNVRLCMYVTDRIQKSDIHLNLVKSLVQHHQTRMTLSFPTVPSAPPSEPREVPIQQCQLSSEDRMHLFGRPGPCPIEWYGCCAFDRLSLILKKLYLPIFHPAFYA